MRDSTRAALKSALFEASFVVFGVIFALLANEWRQERAQREHARQALGFILEELRTNRERELPALYDETLEAVGGTGGGPEPPAATTPFQNRQACSCPIHRHPAALIGAGRT